MRAPARGFGWRDRFMMLWDAAVRLPMIRRRLSRHIPAEQRARGRRRTASAAPPAGVEPVA
jgi:hypothetical protein